MIIFVNFSVSKYIWGSMGVSFVFIGFSVTFYFAVDKAIDYLALHLPFSAFVVRSQSNLIEIEQNLKFLGLDLTYF